jgi:hypothetical protein
MARIPRLRAGSAGAPQRITLSRSLAPTAGQREGLANARGKGGLKGQSAPARRVAYHQRPVRAENQLGVATEGHLWELLQPGS